MVLFLFVLFHPLRTPILGGAIEQGLAGAGSERKVSKSPDSAPEISDSGLMFFFSDFERVPVGHGVYEVEYKAHDLWILFGFVMCFLWVYEFSTAMRGAPEV
ncbi:USP20 [Symbiodinium natans]|uniref:USP20 protein n=1 Tax=Symbiodinium natans TaxID=878477 RepID=A0A812RGB6_9DINO|nr:USP20 [Symbiodinium natans]